MFSYLGDKSDGQVIDATTSRPRTPAVLTELSWQWTEPWQRTVGSMASGHRGAGRPAVDRLAAGVTAASGPGCGWTASSSPAAGTRLRVQGVTYGPFAPDAGRRAVPRRPSACADDFARMRGRRRQRGPHLPRPAGRGSSHLADEAGHRRLRRRALAQAPVLPGQRARPRREARRRRPRGRPSAAGDHPCVLAYSIGNEIPPDIVRWHGARRVERFLAELADVGQAGRPGRPGHLRQLSRRPSTSTCRSSTSPPSTSTCTTAEAFRRYLFRLQNLVGDKPLLLGELGMDTLRHGELEQAEFLAGHLREAALMGLAGAFVFSWTDDWHTGGHPIDDWAFGITHADRSPKASYHALREVFESLAGRRCCRRRRACRSSSAPTTAGRTLDQCLRSLRQLDYPDYEVIVVDDGSTDDTRDDPRPLPGRPGHPPAEPGPERGPQRRAAGRDRRDRRLHRLRLLRRPGLADAPGPPAPADAARRPSAGRT